MKEIVIAGACRTAQGKLGGALRSFTNQELGSVLIRALLERSKVDPDAVDEVIMGCVGQQSDAHNVARVISVMAGIPPRVPAYTVNRNCASGMQALVSAAQAILSGSAGLVIAGGVEVMSAVPFVNRDMRFGKKLRHSVMIDSLWEGLRDPLSGMMMGETAELLAREFSLTRVEQDRYAMESHRRACAAAAGRFKDEIAPVCLPSRDRRLFDTDEGPLPSTSIEVLSQLPSTFCEGGTVTAGNSCQISDGAAALIVASRERAVSLGLRVMAKVKAFGFTGCDPKRMGMGPVAATRKVLDLAGMTTKDIGLFEINESFAAQYLAVEKELHLDRSLVNVNGGAIALGHPVGASGTRIVVTLLHEMIRRGCPAGLASLCVGGGQGGAVLLEL